MSRIVECVPNFSEGKDLNKINAIVAAAQSVSGVVVLDVEKDADHNRSVLSFVVPVENAVEACFRVIKKSSELIDLNFHKGEHPRMGATDVSPFIPVMGSTVAECIELAKQLGARVGAELNIPVYLYDMAAQRPERQNLANVRKGQFEGLRDIIGKDEAHVPDFGPNHIHPTAGAIAIGARQQIVNFNVNLATNDMVFGKALAKKIRTSGGGLPCLRAKEIFLETKNEVQISTVLTDYATTSIDRVIKEIEKEIAPKGIKITGTELIGLTTQDALVNYAVDSLHIEGFSPSAQILETRLSALLGTWQAGANKLVDALADSAPTPGGGSAGAVSAAMGCALGVMACEISAKSKKTDEHNKALLAERSSVLKNIKAELQACVAEDSRAYDLFTAARKLAKDDPARGAAMQKALLYAAEVPLKTAITAARAIKELAPAAPAIIGAVDSDFKSAHYLLEAGIKCAAENVRINLGSIQDKAAAQRMEKELNAVL